MLASVDPALAPEDARRLVVIERALRTASERAGVELSIVHVPMPIGHGSEYFSYINGLRLRDRFVVASFPELPNAVQQRAHAALRQAMPGVELVSVPVVDMQELGGEIHCAVLGLTTAAATVRRRHPV